ncbi:MAG: DoxX family protein [Rubrivivax sp.]|nr:DoxX family protein [Pyrinomonadaceae bacterium]
MTKGRIAKEVLLWAVTIFLALVCLRSGLTKLPGDGFWVRDFQRWGYPGWFRLAVGVAELASFALLLIPRLASFGAGLFAVVMAGAIYTHATHNESSRLPFNFLLLTLALLVLYARRRSLTKKSATAPGRI